MINHLINQIKQDKLIYNNDHTCSKVLHMDYGAVYLFYVVYRKKKIIIRFVTNQEYPHWLTGYKVILQLSMRNENTWICSCKYTGYVSIPEIYKR